MTSRLSRTFGVLLVGLLPLLAFAIVMLKLFEDQQDEAARTLLRQTVASVASAVDKELIGEISGLQGLATSVTLDTGDLERFRIAVTRLMAEHPKWRVITLADRDRLLFNSLVPSGEPLPPVVDKESLACVWSTAAPCVGDLTKSSNDKNRRYVVIRVPVIRNGAPVYVLGAVVSADDYSLFLRDYRPDQNWIVSLADRKNVIIGRTVNAEVYVGTTFAPDFLAEAERNTKDVFTARTKEGLPNYGMFGVVSAAGWKVAVGVPIGVVEAPYRTLLYSVWFGGAAAAALAAALLAALLRSWDRVKTAEAIRTTQQRLARVLESTTDGVIELDRDWRIVSINDQARAIIAKGQDITGKPLWDEHPEVRGIIEGQYRRVLDTGKPTEFEVHTPWLAKWLLVRAVPTNVGTAMYFQDITTRKTAEIEARTAAERLAVTVRQAEEARAEAERANLAKSKFLAAASHDLRQPVQAMVLFQGALAERLRDHPAASMLKPLGGAIDALRVLLDSLLDVSKLDAGLIISQPVDMPLGPILKRLGAEYHPQATAKGLRLRVVSTGAAVRSDPVLLERILRNLVENALRYTECGGVLLGCRRHGEWLRIEVVDTGIGIEADKQVEIFDEFIQVGNLERDRTMGLGLGLAVVRRLARLLGHEVRVRSVPGRGSTFSIEVPVVAMVVGSEPPLVAPAKKRDGLILVIDDEPLVRLGMQAMLEGWGYRVLTAGSVAEATSHVERGEWPSAILADYRLRGGETGLDAIRAVYERLDAPVPAAIITGDTAPERLVEVRVGGHVLLHKPVAANELRNAVVEMLPATG